MRVGQILVLLRWNALSHAKKHMSAWKSVSFVNKCFLSIHHSQEIYRTWRVPYTKRNLLPFSRIWVHRCFFYGVCVAHLFSPLCGFCFICHRSVSFVQFCMWVRFIPFLIDLSDFFHFDVIKELSMYFIGE